MKLIKILKYKSETEYDLFLTKIYSWVYCFLKIIDNSRYGNYSTKFSTHYSTEAQNIVVKEREHQRYVTFFGMYTLIKVQMVYRCLEKNTFMFSS